MLGNFGIFPLLDGWDYYTYNLVGTVLRGAPPKELRITDKGWVFIADAITTDAYGTVEMVPETPASLQSPSLVLWPDNLFALGFVTTNPGGALTVYFRPNPASSVGYYHISAAMAGLVPPWRSPVKVRISLQLSSNQASAYVNAFAAAIRIIDEDAFKKSLRDVLGIKDPSKFIPGMVKRP